MELKENQLHQGPIDPRLITEFISAASALPEIGANSLFLGKVRADIVNGKKVQKILYSAYEEVVAAETVKIKKEIFDAFNDVKEVVIIHSIGEVNVGEISLLIFVASGHRDHSYRACREVLEKIKERLPIWKKEVFEDEAHRWKGVKAKE